MYVLSFSDYVAGDVGSIRRRLATATASAPADSSIDVAPWAGDDLSRVVVRMRWDGRDEPSRRNSTLTAARYAAMVFDEARAA